MQTPIWHSLSIADTLATLETSLQGLGADEVVRRQERYGNNGFPTRKTDPWWVVLVRQFMSPMILVLLAAAVISVGLADFVDAGVIAASVIVNTIIGFVQEYKANKALEQLRSLVQPRALVRRQGKEISIPASHMVPGDILLLHTGDRVTADARILEGVDLSVNEAALTGESFPVQKQTDLLDASVSLAERSDIVYAGTSIVGGRGQAVVVATGLQTELGRIAKLVDETPETRTPLQEQLARLARWLAALVVFLVVILFFFGIVSGRSLVEMFEMSVALSVAAIPEGLVVSVTVILAIGMQRILRRKSLVRRLVAAETLGSVSIICTDKTGTITQGEMRVTHLVTPTHTWTFPFSHRERDAAAISQLLNIMALCNDATMVDDTDHSIQGSPTERSLLATVVEQGIDIKALGQQYPRVWEIPFDSAYKYMVTAHASGKETDVFLKGAPDVVLPFCSSIEVDGKRQALTPFQHARIQEQVSSLSRMGIRLMVLASRSVKADLPPLSRESLSAFTFLGIVGLRDPLRQEARTQIAQAKAAGIRTVVVTGDHPETARAIAVEAGLVMEPESVVVGSQLDGWSDEELVRRVSRISLYARVEPRHKIRIVNAWQSRGDVVAMTGDGVNDAPALKAADIGLAVGSGTEVAKQASDMVILDNDLGTITAAIEEGRVIFDNIRKVTVYLLAGSFTELTLIGTSILFGWPLPLLPAHILWINLVADSFPSIGLTLEPSEKDVMKLPPRSRGEPVLNRRMFLLTGVIALVIILVLIAFYVWLLGSGEDIGKIRSLMFVALGVDSLIYIFAVKSFRHTIFRVNVFSNRWLLASIGIGFSLMLAAVFHPFLQEIFAIIPLTLSEWGLILMISLLKLLLIEGIKELFFYEASYRAHSDSKELPRLKPRTS